MRQRNGSAVCASGIFGKGDLPAYSARALSLLGLRQPIHGSQHGIE
jgi:hypothetical protein